MKVGDIADVVYFNFKVRSPNFREEIKMAERNINNIQQDRCLNWNCMCAGWWSSEYAQILQS